MNQLYFYTTRFSPRVQYLVQVLENRLGCPCVITTLWEQFIAANGPKINYSTQKYEHSIQIIPHSLLLQKNIKTFDFSTLEQDPLAFIFFLLTRYEEYIIKDRDEHGRFSAQSSYLYQTKRLHIPVVDRLIENLKTKIKAKYPAIQFKDNPFKTAFTIDIDQAFCYQHKPFKRWMGGNARDLFGLNFKSIIDRNLSYIHLNKDPWDIYTALESLSENRQTQAQIFFLVGDYSPFNKNLNHQNKAFKNVIQQVEVWAEVGLHPSYNAGGQLATIQEEKKRLEDILQKEIINSRQHYIQLTLPTTYKNLIAAGIQHDYTMGFADDIGFRAGTSFPFNWYDLENEAITDLCIHPFCAMDVTLRHYLKLNLEQAEQALESLKKEIQAVNGIFSIITHNESLSDYGEWRDWQKLLLQYWL